MIAPVETTAQGERSTPDDPEQTNILNLPFVEQLYADFLRSPSLVPTEWKPYFQKIQDSQTVEPPRLGPSFRPPTLFNPVGSAPASTEEDREAARLQQRVFQLVRNYRVRGHNLAAVDPLGMPRSRPPELDLSYFGFVRVGLGSRGALRDVAMRGTAHGSGNPGGVARYLLPVHRRAVHAHR